MSPDPLHTLAQVREAYGDLDIYHALLLGLIAQSARIEAAAPDPLSAPGSAPAPASDPALDLALGLLALGRHLIVTLELRPEEAPASTTPAPRPELGPLLR